MTNLGGGAEAHARFKQYGYRANSSLVLTTDSRPRDDIIHEPTGEPESLWGKIDPNSFGDRAFRGRPNKKKKKERDGPLATKSKRRRLQEESVLTATDHGVYQPQTKETRAAYEAMLSVIQRQLGGQPLSIASAAADEILAVLKNDTVKNLDKKKYIEKLLNPIPPNQVVFHQLVSIGKLITDFHDASNNADGGLDDDVGVAVEFEENEDDYDDDDEESDLDMVQEEEEASGAMQTGGGIDDEDMEEANEGMMNSLNVQDIDAYWLQRKISQAFEEQKKIDPQQCQKLAEEVLKILGEPDDDDREVENKLLFYLEFDKFSLIKFLLRNRLKIVWCTRLARAQDQEEREKIEEKMKWSSDLQPILEQLHHATRASAKERQKNLEKRIREEARRLKEDDSVGDGDKESGWLEGQRQMLDLDSLAFAQGGFFMAKKKCDLPADMYQRKYHHKEGYEEIHVPALKAKPLDPDERLVKISCMPDWAQPAFKGMTQLNRVQSKVYETALFKPDNLLLCAPTGAGKTNVAVLTILQEIARHRNHEDGILWCQG